MGLCADRALLLLMTANPAMYDDLWTVILSALSGQQALPQFMTRHDERELAFWNALRVLRGVSSSYEMPRVPVIETRGIFMPATRFP